MVEENVEKGESMDYVETILPAVHDRNVGTWTGRVVKNWKSNVCKFVSSVLPLYEVWEINNNKNVWQMISFVPAFRYYFIQKYEDFKNLWGKTIVRGIFFTENNLLDKNGSLVLIPEVQALI